MALNQFEFFGNDRYFKYKYSQETPLNATTVANAWEMENHASRYDIIEDYFKRSLNMKVYYEEHKISIYDMPKLYTEPHVFNKAHIILIAVASSFFYGRERYFSPTQVFQTDKTIIVSGGPKRVLSTSLSFLNMDTEVVILIGLTVVLLSFLLVIHSIVTNKYKSLPTKKVVKKITQETLENVWENASLLCAEPIPSVLSHITCRLVASSWLIGVTFILFFLGCYLRTEFTTESYNRIHTLSDLIKSGIPPIMFEETGTLDKLKLLAAKDPVVKEWLDALDMENIFGNPGDYIFNDGYIPILSGEKVLITSDAYLTWIMGEYLTSDSESKPFLVNNGGLHFSHSEINIENLHFIFNTSWMRSSPLVEENAQLLMAPLMETQVFEHPDYKVHHHMEQVKWKRPMKSISALDLRSLSTPFYFHLMLLSATVATVITEIIFN